MRIIKNIFKGDQSKTQNNDSGPMPTRSMKFKYSLIPENGEKFADQYKNAVKENDNLELDYSVGSLQFVDSFLQRFREEGMTVNDFAETIFVAGCYTGQVMIRNNHGQWIKAEDISLPNGVRMMPIVIKFPNGKICDPIAKAFKRFYNGEADSLQYFFHVFTSDDI
jgi:hypothetical protein